MAGAPDGGGGARGLRGVCEQSRSWAGARPPPAADGVPPGRPGAPPAGERVHYAGAPAARGGVSLLSKFSVATPSLGFHSLLWKLVIILRLEYLKWSH